MSNFDFVNLFLHSISFDSKLKLMDYFNKAVQETICLLARNCLTYLSIFLTCFINYTAQYKSFHST